MSVKKLYIVNFTLCITSINMNTKSTKRKLVKRKRTKRSFMVTS